MISRRKLLSSLGLATAIAAFPTVLMVPDAEAQTAGMERRQDRREGHRERRDILLHPLNFPIRPCRTLEPHTSVAALASIASHRAFVTMANAPHLP